MSFWGIDFNEDGEVSLGECMITLDMMGFFDDEEARKASASDAFDGCFDLEDRDAEFQETPDNLEDW